MRAALAAAFVAALFGAVVAVVVQEVWGIQAFWPGLGRPLVALALAGGSGLLVGWGAAWAQGREAENGPGRSSLVGAIVAAATAALLLHAPLPWTNLSVFGAGPAGSLPLVVLPLALAAAGWVAGARAGVSVRDHADRPRG